MGKKITFFKGIMFLFIMLSVIFIINNYAAFFQGIPVIGYVVLRFTNRENAIWETDNLGILSILIQFITLSLFYFGIFKSKLKSNIKILKLFYISIMLISLILINYNNTEIASRFNFYIYTFFPLAMYFLYEAIHIKDMGSKNFINIFFVVFFTLWFVYKINNSAWQYNNLELFFLTFL